MAYDNGFKVEVELKIPEVVVGVGDADSNNVGGVGCGKGAWIFYWVGVGGMRVGGEAAAHHIRMV